MPQIGEIQKGNDLGYGNHSKHIWAACIDCGKERWSPLVKGKPYYQRCVPCALKASTEKRAKRGERHPFWKGGRRYDKRGHVTITLMPNDPMYCMAWKKGIAFEHRIIVARHLGRPLLRSEIVHHINGIKDDNRLENLELMPNGQTHGKYLACSHCPLRKEVRLLQWHVKEQEAQIKELTTHLFMGSSIREKSDDVREPRGTAQVD